MKEKALTPLAKGWQWHKLGDCVRLINGRAYAQHELLDVGTPVIRIQNLNGGDRWYYSDLNLPGDKYCYRGDLLFAWSASFGPYIWDGDKSIFHYHIWRVIPNERIDKAFAFRLLDWITAKVKSASHGVAMLHMTKAGMEAWPIPLPPIAEQRRIAAILDQADALRAKRRETLAQLDSLTQSIFIEMFGDPATNPRGWQCKPFGNLSRNQDAQRIPVKSADRDGRQGQYPYYGASGIIDWVDDYIYEGERLLIGEDGANLIARSTPIAYMAQGKFWVNNHAHVVAFNGRANLRFLEFFLEQFDLKPFISGSAQPKLNRANLDRIQVPVPPLELQNVFADQISAVEKTMSTSKMALIELDALFASLQHRAFRGEL